MTTDRPPLTAEHCLDAVAICRATLRGDEPALMALFSNCDVAMTFQALVRMHIGVLSIHAENVEQLDRHFAEALDVFNAPMDEQ